MENKHIVGNIINFGLSITNPVFHHDSDKYYIYLRDVFQEESPTTARISPVGKKTERRKKVTVLPSKTLRCHYTPVH